MDAPSIRFLSEIEIRRPVRTRRMRAVSLSGSVTRDHGEPLRELKVSLEVSLFGSLFGSSKKAAKPSCKALPLLNCLSRRCKSALFQHDITRHPRAP
jgi:hypothetical protein